MSRKIILAIAAIAKSARCVPTCSVRTASISCATRACLIRRISIITTTTISPGGHGAGITTTTAAAAIR